MKRLVVFLALAAMPFCGESISSWKTITTEAAGLDGARLDAWKESLAAHHTTGLLVIRRGAIAYEWYAPGFGPERSHYTASMAKALVGGMSLMVAMNDGLIAADDLACRYIPAWKNDPRKSRITIRHLATHTSGIEDAEQDNLPHDKLEGWKGQFWKRSPDPFSLAIHTVPDLFEPGRAYAYSNPGMAALAYAVTASLKDTRWKDIRTLLKERIMDPVEIPENQWSIGYGRAYEVDGLKLYANWGGGGYTARAAARVGQLMMLEGAWEGREVVPRASVKRALTYAGMPKSDRSRDPLAPAWGLAWCTNYDGVWPDVPKDAFIGAGSGHQVLVVVPSLDLIVVRNGEAIRDHAQGFWPPVYEELLRPLIAAVKERGPYPPSPVIRKIVFAPDIKRSAIESDNWPLTWADDDAQYTSYGDGWGFEPLTDRKLGMGFARVTGSADNFTGVNIRSATGERVGNGIKSAKASGMLMVNGVLYMWVRNVSNSQLVWSRDHGKTWEWGFRVDTSFGSPAFLNFGRNYQGARDGYVYTYSQNGPSAYESDNELLLARVQKEKLTDWAAWQFYERTGESGQPVWTKDILRRGAVFRHPRGCQRVDVVYNPGIKRYLMALGFNHNGAWGIFDAPEPWGPWTTAFHTDDWGLGGTHGYRLPSKWISADGLSMTLVFSGVRLPTITYDAFCTRSFKIEVSR
jgi:CubicO group peptidase (beta-lactamase class C family)